jgi:hypothetical protein
MRHRPAAGHARRRGVEPDVRFDGATELRGTVRTTAGGRPIPEARVTLLDPAGDVVGVTLTAADGSYAFTDLDGNHYTVVAAGYPAQAMPLSLEGSGRDVFDLTLAHEES